MKLETSIRAVLLTVVVALFPLIPLVAAQEADLPAEITFETVDGDVSYTLDDLLAEIETEVVTIDDPYYGGEVTFEAFPLPAVLEFAGTDAVRGTALQFEAADGYGVALNRIDLQNPANTAYLAFRVVDAAEGDWDPIEFEGESINPAPFYLTWDVPADMFTPEELMEALPFPWQLTNISVTTPTELTIVTGDGETTYTRDDLLELVETQTVMVDDPLYEEAISFEAFLLADLLEVTGAVSADSSAILFQAADGYAVPMDLATLSRPGFEAYVTFATTDAEDGDFTLMALESGDVDPAPYYLTWIVPDGTFADNDEFLAQLPFPYQLIRITVG